jgi:exosortase
MNPFVQAQPPDESRAGLGARPRAAPPCTLGLFSVPLPFETGARNVAALLLFLGLCAWFWPVLDQLLSFALTDENFSHVILIPWVSLYLLAQHCRVILASREWSPILGGLVMGLGVLGYAYAGLPEREIDQLAMATAACVVLCWGLFLLCFGTRQCREHAFALLFLLLMVPLPAAMLEHVIGFLQRSSAEVSAVFFSLLGVPIFREGFVFSLSQFTIHVAEECSGIRSFLSLVITSLLAGYWFLQTGWARAGLVAIVVPLAIAKNAMRIVGLALLANYVDPAFITNSPLHRGGGIPLFGLSLVVLAVLVWVLRRFEQRHGHRAEQRIS